MVRLVVSSLVVLALLGAPPAVADEPLATVTEFTPVVAEGRTAGWLTQPTDGGRERVLAYRTGNGPVVTTTVAAGDDLGVGRDARGRITFTWSACERGARRCPVYGLRPGQDAPRVLARVRRAGTDLAPALAGSRLVVARRLDRPRGARRCDVPVVVRLTGRPRRRALRPRVCGEIVRMAVDRGRVLARFFNVPGAGTLSEQLQAIPLGGGAAREIQHTSGTMAPNDIGGFGLRGDHVDFALPGGAERAPLFARYSLHTGRTRKVRAGEPLTTGYAPVGRGAVFLVPRIDEDFAEVSCTPAVPCTVVASDDVFRPRTLIPRVRLSGGGKTTTVTGRLERRRTGRRRTQTTGIAGVEVELYSTDGSDFETAQYPDRATPTGLRGVTGRDGRFAITLPEPGYPVDYVARTVDAGVPATGYLPTG